MDGFNSLVETKANMKHIIFFFAIVCISCSESEGEDDPKFCFDCMEKKTESSPSGYYKETDTETTHCQITNAEAERIRKDGTRSETDGSILINYHTTCVKQ